MKAVLMGVIAAIIIALAAAQLLHTELQQDAAEHFRTAAVRL